MYSRIICQVLLDLASALGIFWAVPFVLRISGISDTFLFLLLYRATYKRQAKLRFILASIVRVMRRLIEFAAFFCVWGLFAEIAGGRLNISLATWLFTYFVVHIFYTLRGIFYPQRWGNRIGVLTFPPMKSLRELVDNPPRVLRGSRIVSETRAKLHPVDKADVEPEPLTGMC
jgi:hypothetical protein